MRRRAIVTSAVMLVAMSAVSADGIAPRAVEAGATPIAFRWQGEELFYKVRLNGTDFAHAVVKLGAPRLRKGKPYVALSAKARSVGALRLIYPLDDKANTYIDPRTMLPLRSEKTLRERNKARTYRVDYDHDARRAKVKRVRLSPESGEPERESRYTRRIPERTHDAFTWFLDLRGRAPLEPGQKISYYIQDGWKLSRLDLTARGTERVQTPLGWFDALRYDIEREILRAKAPPAPEQEEAQGAASAKKQERAQAEGGESLEPLLEVRTPSKGVGAVWLTQDARRLPVRVEIASTMGMGEVVLSKYSRSVARP